MDDIKLLKICIVIAFILASAMICLYIFQDKTINETDATEEFMTISNPLKPVFERIRTALFITLIEYFSYLIFLPFLFMIFGGCIQTKFLNSL